MSAADFEQLRMLARWSGDDPESLAVATADTLVSFAHDAAGLLVACRRLVAHHPDVAPLWWLAARILSTNDPARETVACAHELQADPTPRHLFDALPSPANAAIPRVGRAEPLPRNVAEVVACDGTRVAFASEGQHVFEGDPPASNTWIMVRVGRHLPGALFDALVRSSTQAGTGLCLRPLDETDLLVGEHGVGSPQIALGDPRCGAPPELLHFRA